MAVVLNSVHHRRSLFDLLLAVGVVLLHDLLRHNMIVVKEVSAM